MSAWFICYMLNEVVHANGILVTKAINSVLPSITVYHLFCPSHWAFSWVTAFSIVGRVLIVPFLFHCFFTILA